MVRELILGPCGSREGLTARESQIRRLLGRGHTTAEIARRLGISPMTVRRHISEVVVKTRAG
ncbi:MAG: helix-turn-helix domain-containing protein [Solirubrobacteraceae bacterium]